MSTILDEIVATKRNAVAHNKSLYPVQLLEKSIYFATTPLSLKHYIQRPDKSGIIAEIKKKSPSKGMINPHVSVERTSIGYMQAGASALSILTDGPYFAGKNEDLTTARKFNYCPILRKDFIIDEYQIIEAKSIGADAILLIAAVLTPDQVKSFARTAKSLGLEVLLEVHNQEELERSYADHIDLVGVNNRNLKTFEVNIENAKQLSAHIPQNVVKVAESGISSPEAIAELRKSGFEGFLIGEHFMKTSRPELTCARFIEALSKLDQTEYA